jgi:hypothetical protein
VNSKKLVQRHEKQEKKHHHASKLTLIAKAIVLESNATACADTCARSGAIACKVEVKEEKIERNRFEVKTKCKLEGSSHDSITEATRGFFAMQRKQRNTMWQRNNESQRKSSRK